jgi:hypothetical protein
MRAAPLNLQWSKHGISQAFLVSVIPLKVNEQDRWWSFSGRPIGNRVNKTAIGAVHHIKIVAVDAGQAHVHIRSLTAVSVPTTRTLCWLSDRAISP